MSNVHSVTSTSALLGYVPALLGFVPVDSVVILGIGVDGLIRMAGRVDADSDPNDGVKSVVAAFLRNDVAVVSVIGYHTTADSNALPVVTAMAAGFTDAGIRVHGPVFVIGDQLAGATYCCLCDCPDMTGDAPAVGQMPTESLRCLRTRDDLSRAIEPGPRATRVGALTHTVPVPVSVETAQKLMTAGLTVPVDKLSDDTVAAIADMLNSSNNFRDLALVGRPLTDTCDDDTIFNGTIARLQTPDNRLDQLIGLAACLPDGPATGVLLVLAGTAYALGNGALTNLAIDRVYRSEPNNSLAHLFDKALRNAIPPTDIFG